MTEPALDESAFQHLLDITGGDIDFLDELVDTYLEDGAAQVAAMRDAAAAGDAAAMLRPAHTLKSSSASVGAVVVAALSADLEAEARAGEVPDAVGRAAICAAAFEAARDALLAERRTRG
jgi:HPt (histidine-containing phosphotransfer) domain-containing protein